MSLWRLLMCLQYNMSLSTVAMPCNTSGPLDPEFFSQFGIVDVDWSHMKAVWYAPSPLHPYVWSGSALLRKESPIARCFTA
jgi:hypothetical protein